MVFWISGTTVVLQDLDENVTLWLVSWLWTWNQLCSVKMVGQHGNDVIKSLGRPHTGLAAPLVVGLPGGLAKVHDAGDAGEADFYLDGEGKLVYVMVNNSI